MKPKIYANKVIKEIRLNKGFSQGKLAELAGITRQYLSEVENQKKNISPDLATKISEILNKPFSEIFFVQVIDNCKSINDNCKVKVSQ